MPKQPPVAIVFDTFGTVAIGTNDQAQAVIRGNEFRENTLVPVTSLPTDYPGATLPVFSGWPSVVLASYRP